MDDSIKNIIGLILKHEGGYVNNPNDPGGETNFGISKRAYPHLNIRSLTKEDAIDIYYTDYYLYNSIDKFPLCFQSIALDTVVLHGKYFGSKILQEAYNKYANDTVLAVDGIIGEKTLSVYNNATNTKLLINSIVDVRIQTVQNLVKKNNSLHVFLKGWINRFESFREV